MKRRTDTQAQQYRIRAEYAARKAQSLAELALDEWQRLRTTTAIWDGRVLSIAEAQEIEQHPRRR